MIIFYRQRGVLAHDNGDIFATGIWSGFKDAENNPAKESLPDIGPLPAGEYNIGVMQLDGHQLGPHVMPLHQTQGDSFGRSGFFIHGDSAGDVDWTASHGCIIAPRWVRDFIDTLPDRTLKVV